jgi:anaerobic magnesium-protoporphyrin IX monomethyl ester cyclase
MYQATYAPAVYRRVHGLVHHEFRARKSASALSALVKAPWEMRPSHARRAASWLYNRSALAVTRWRLENLRGEPS